MKLPKTQRNTGGYHKAYVLIAEVLFWDAFLIVGMLYGFNWAIPIAFFSGMTFLIVYAKYHSDKPQYDFTAWNKAIDDFVENNRPTVPELRDYELN